MTYKAVLAVAVKLIIKMSARLIYMQGGNSNRLHSTGKGYFMAHTKNSKIFEILQGYCKTLNVRWDLSSRF